MSNPPVIEEKFDPAKTKIAVEIIIDAALTGREITLSNNGRWIMAYPNDRFSYKVIWFNPPKNARSSFPDRPITSSYALDIIRQKPVISIDEWSDGEFKRII